MKPIPKEVKAREGRVAIRWSDGHASEYPTRELRLACRCALCVDEWTHENLINPNLIPMEVAPKAIEVVGNYALQFTWSDAHSSGIYTYDYLRDICGCAECRSKRSFDV